MNKEQLIEFVKKENDRLNALLEDCGIDGSIFEQKTSEKKVSNQEELLEAKKKMNNQSYSSTMKSDKVYKTKR